MTTRPDLMQFVQTWMWRTVPPLTVFTRWMFGFQIFRVLLLAWDTLCPKFGPFPQSAHFAMVSSGNSTDGRYHKS